MKKRPCKRAVKQSGGARPDGRARWRTLSHHGVALPPPYVPHGRPILWRGLKVQLPPDAEEAITAFVRRGGVIVGGRATLLGSEAPARRFWQDWSRMLPRGCPIDSLAGCDLSRVVEAALRKKKKKAAGTKAEQDPHASATVDGKLQPVAPWAVDRPGVFAGRNASAALSGRYRRRITASDVTINIGRGVAPPAPGGWAAVVHDATVDWIARWRDPVTGVVKYARLAPSSAGEQAADLEKYELARRLHARLPALRRRAESDLASDSAARRQLGACLWLIDRLALRVGSGTPEQAARDGAHGATTLLRKHVRVASSAVMHLDFPGKDGVRYLRRVRGAPSALVALVGSPSSSTNAPLFKGTSAKDVGAAVAEALPGATPKVLRTCRASETFERTLFEALPAPQDKAGARAAELALLLAGARVAVLCNHRRAVGAVGAVRPAKASPAGGGPRDLSTLDAAVVALTAELASAAARASPVPAKTVARLSRSLAETVVRPAGLSLSTSRSNYVDPRIVFAFYARCGGIQEKGKYFSAALRKRFAWAAETPETFRFAAPAVRAA